MFSQFKARRGKVSWLATAVTAAVVGTAGVVGTVSVQSPASKSIPTGLSRQTLQSSSIDTVFDSSQEEIRLPSPAPAAAPKKKMASDHEPAGGSAIRMSISDMEKAFAVEANEATGGETPSSSKDFTVGPPSESSNAEYSQVEVYFATDRDQIDPTSWTLWLRILFPACLGGFICLTMLVGLAQAKEKWLWGLGLSLGLILTALFSHHALIYGQQANRMAQSHSAVFGTRRYEPLVEYPLHLGVGYVTIPKNHVKGKIEAPELMRFEFREDPTKHVVLQQVEVRDEIAFFDSLKTDVQKGASLSTFVFIHGFNVQFAEALSRTAQIKKDLQFDGPAILYSWPSHGDLLAYSKDGDNASWTIAHLERFLKDVKQRTGAKDLHVIAHSMGNRALVGALERLQSNKEIEQPILSQLVMAAPDVDAAEFQDRYSKAVDACSRRTTLYTSSTDRALLASFRIHGYPRLGLSTGTPMRFEGVDTIEVSPIDPSLLGHSYYGSHPLLIRDLQAIIELDEPPTLRKWLIPFTDSPTKLAWRFSPKVTAEESLKR